MPMLAYFEELAAEERRRSARRALKLGVGATFEIELPQAGPVEATVVWNSGEYYGCQFELPIRPVVLSAALLQSQADPGPGNGDPLAELKELNSEVERLAWKMDTALRRLTKK